MLESSRSAVVAICARDDTQVTWYPQLGDEELAVTTHVSTEKCGATGQHVVTSSLHSKTPGEILLEVELVSPLCEAGENPMLSVTCECAASPTCKTRVNPVNVVFTYSNDVQVG